MLYGIEYIVKLVRFTCNDVCDYWINTPLYDVYEMDSCFVVKIDLAHCCNSFKIDFRRKCGRSFECFAKLAKYTVCEDFVYFYSCEMIGK